MRHGTSTRAMPKLQRCLRQAPYHHGEVACRHACADWAVLADAALPKRFRAALSDPDAEVHVSAVSVWEVAIKRTWVN